MFIFKIEPGWLRACVTGETLGRQRAACSALPSPTGHTLRWAQESARRGALAVPGMAQEVGPFSSDSSCRRSALRPALFVAR